MEYFVSALLTSNGFKIKCIKDIITSLVLRRNIELDLLIYTHVLKRMHRNIWIYSVCFIVNLVTHQIMN